MRVTVRIWTAVWPLEPLERMRRAVKTEPVRFERYPLNPKDPIPQGSAEYLLSEELADLKVLDDVLAEHQIRHYRHRMIEYTPQEIEQAPYHTVLDEPVLGIDASPTRFERLQEDLRTGRPWRQVGPVLLNHPAKLVKYTTRKKHLILLQHTAGVFWLASDFAVSQLSGLSGVTFGDVAGVKSPSQPLSGWRQLIIGPMLPPASSEMKFVSHHGVDPDKPGASVPLLNMTDGQWIYDSGVLDDASDFNLTFERVGGGATPNWTVVSQRARRMLIDSRILRRNAFAPVHIKGVFDPQHIAGT